LAVEVMDRFYEALAELAVQALAAGGAAED
jgi:hypothetical protein